MDMVTGGGGGEAERGGEAEDRAEEGGKPKRSPSDEKAMEKMDRGGAEMVGSDRVASHEEGNARAGRARGKGGKWADRD